MKRKWLAIGISNTVVVLLVLGSLSNVVGYQSVQTSQQNVIKERIDQRELLFQTIVDIANNKEIQRIILNSQMSRGIVPTSDIPVLTKQQLKQMYFIGLILSKFLSKSRIHSLVSKYQISNQEMQKEISAVIEKDVTLKGEITQLQDADCDCENEINEEKISTADIYDSPIICGILLILLIVCLVILAPFNYIEEMFHNTIFEPLAILFLLIILPIWIPFSLIGISTTYLFFFTFDCFPEVGPPN